MYDAVLCLKKEDASQAAIGAVVEDMDVQWRGLGSLHQLNCFHFVDFIYPKLVELQVRLRFSFNLPKTSSVSHYLRFRVLNFFNLHKTAIE